MARLILTFPEDQYYYTTLLTVRVTDINAANHLGNDSMISMIDFRASSDSSKRDAEMNASPSADV